jgi:hypothetical protein
VVVRQGPWPAAVHRPEASAASAHGLPMSQARSGQNLSFEDVLAVIAQMNGMWL